MGKLTNDWMVIVMPTKKKSVIHWRDGWITPRQMTAIKKIEQHSDYDYGYRGLTVRDASAFITDYQEDVQAKIEYDNLNDSGYTGHGQWQDG